MATPLTPGAVAKRGAVPDLPEVVLEEYQMPSYVDDVLESSAHQHNEDEHLRDDSDDEEGIVDPDAKIRRTVQEVQVAQKEAAIAEDFIQRSVAADKEYKDMKGGNQGYMSENEKYKNELLQKALKEKKATIVCNADHRSTT